MKRGEIWTVAGAKDYAGKPRPCIIVQDDRFPDTDSITVCAVSTSFDEAVLFRIVVEPTSQNGLSHISSIMADKVTTVAKTKLGRHVGILDSEDMARLNSAILVFLGLVEPTLAIRD